MTRLNREQIRAVDRLAVEKYQIPGVVLMENAARAVAGAARAMLAGRAGARVLILCGGGNNGGDGLAAARHLHNWGFDISIGLCAEAAHYKGEALVNWQIVQAMRLPAARATSQSIVSALPELIVDGIFGTGLSQPARPPFPSLVDAIERAAAGVLAIDLPSGLDCDTGIPLGCAVRATKTITFVAEKTGFASSAARQFTGQISVADIGCPRELIEEVTTVPPNMPLDRHGARGR